MDIDKQLLENIIMVDTDKTDIFDDIENQEEKMTQNKDLYDVFFRIKKLLETGYGGTGMDYIQTIAPAIDVNTGTIGVDGVCFAQNGSSDANLSNNGDVVDRFVKSITDIVPKGFSVDHTMVDEPTGVDNTNTGKSRFKIIISKGE